MLMKTNKKTANSPVKEECNKRKKKTALNITYGSRYVGEMWRGLHFVRVYF